MAPEDHFNQIRAIESYTSLNLIVSQSHQDEALGGKTTQNGSLTTEAVTRGNHLAFKLSALMQRSTDL